ncbi:MAG: periplasmic heavy metal sensor [Acidimicrobiia bacterium]|nr:periplasmic heavy metal sensor [Acidimicrobiia bacterium]
MRVARRHRVNRVWAPALLWLLVALLATPAHGQRPTPWWQSTQFQKDLGITSDQVAKVEAVFQATLPELRARLDELKKLETKLSHLIEADADKAAVARFVDKTEAARGALNKVRTLMLVRMRQVLTPEQRARFSELHAARDRHRHGRGPDRSPSAPTAPTK